MTKTAAEVQKELAQRKKKSKRQKADYVKISEGTTYLRFMPPWEKGGEFWKDVLFHGSFKRKVYCKQNDVRENGKPRKCLVEVRLAELKGTKTTKARKLWGLINQRSESLWNVLVVKKYRKLEDDKIKVLRYEDSKAKLLRLSAKWHDRLLEIFANEKYRKKSILGITHSKYGRLVKVVREGTDKDDTDYKFYPVKVPTAIFEDKEKRIAILKTMYDLDSMVYGSSNEELETFLSRMEKKAKALAAAEDVDREDDDEDEDADEEDEEDRPKKKKSTKHRDDDEDDEDEDSGEEDDEEDDGELEKKYKEMKKGLKRKKKAKEEDEDDEDEEESEEDDE